MYQVVGEGGGLSYTSKHTCSWLQNVTFLAICESRSAHMRLCSRLSPAFSSYKYQKADWRTGGVATHPHFEHTL